MIASISLFLRVALLVTTVLVHLSCHILESELSMEKASNGTNLIRVRNRQLLNEGLVSVSVTTIERVRNLPIVLFKKIFK